MQLLYIKKLLKVNLQWDFIISLKYFSVRILQITNVYTFFNESRSIRNLITFFKLLTVIN